MKRFILMMASGLILTNASAQRWSGTRQHLTFDGPITKQEVRYSIYLPAGYEETTNRYPVLYYLHGIGGDETDSPKLIDALEPAVESGLVPPMIVVFANGQNNSMWANSKQGPKQVETNVIKELIPYVDATYRTIVDRHSRALLGFSMGGYGAATYACKYPELFSACISYDGAMLDWASLSARQRGIVDEIFSNDEEYYNQTSPWENSTKNADAIRDGVAIRMVVGKLKDRNLEFRKHLETLGIPVEYVDTDCGHSFPCLLETDGDETFALLARSFKQAAHKEPTALKDLAYVTDGHDLQKLDLYLPNGDGPFPLIIWIHGGAFFMGSKEEHVPVDYLNRGYAIASLNYRLSQHALFPAQIEDCKSAVRWLRANAKTYSLAPDRFCAWGGSAGGHLASMLGTTGSTTEFDVGENLEFPSKVQAVVDYYGPTDFLQMDAHRLPDGLKHDGPKSPESRLIGGPIQQNKDKVAAANPITYVTKDCPPFLIVHGDQDPMVPHHQSVLLKEALEQTGVPVLFYTVPGGGHGEFTDPKVPEITIPFLENNLRKP